MMRRTAILIIATVLIVAVASSSVGYMLASQPYLNEKNGKVNDNTPITDNINPTDEVNSTTINSLNLKINNVTKLISELQTKLETLTPKVILHYTEGFDREEYWTNGAQIVKDTFISCDKPVLFTVYLEMQGKGQVKIYVHTETSSSSWSNNVVEEFQLTGGRQTTTVAFPGKEMYVSFYPPNQGDQISVTYHILLEGNPDTELTVKNPS